MKAIGSIAMLFVLAGCAVPNPGPATSKTYRILIPQFVMEFTMPPGWQRASYAVIKSEITFETPPRRDAYALPGGATAKSLNSFFYGVRGDFSDWDMEMRGDVIKFERPIRSEEELAVYLTRYFTEPALLMSGEKYFEYADPKIETIGGKKIITMDTRTLSYRDEVVLANRGIRSFHPTHGVYLLVSESIAVRFYLEHESKKLASPDSFARSRKVVLDIAAGFKFTPRLSDAELRPNQAPEPTPGSVTPRANQSIPK